MDIVRPSMDTADAIADHWVTFASRQREYGSHLLPDQNRTRIRETVARYIIRDQMLVAREDDIRGFVMYTLEASSYEKDIRRGVIENIYVEPAAQSQGIGSKLLSAAEQDLAEAGASAVTLDVLAPNERARSFYREHGYTPHRIECEKSLDADDTPSAENDTHSRDDV
jgi:ribosomal protein S18 acetylase RimI-like enzyme